MHIKSEFSYHICSVHDLLRAPFNASSSWLASATESIYIQVLTVNKLFAECKIL